MNPVRYGVPVVLRLVLGGVLTWAGLAKITEPALFAMTVRAYNVLPNVFINGFAVVVPWMEIAAGACLLAGFWSRSGALAALALLSSFGVAIAVNIYRGADLDCGCFGLDGTRGSLNAALAQDLLLIACSLVLLFVRNMPLSLDRCLFGNADR
ncbi:MAG: DoxX family membrane protein [Gemmatimonadota bacterium]|nr:DoxX family membrane protein [Gemmatimonadota bacterium]